MADEILYQARLHPACPVPLLSSSDVERLHHWIRRVPEIAVSVNADSRKFPADWLFRWRWGKGRKQERRVQKAVDAGQVVQVKEEVVQIDTAKDRESGPGLKVEESSDAGEESEDEGEEKMEDIKPKNVDFLALVSGLIE